VMDELNRLIWLRQMGLSSEGIGPPGEWAPSPGIVYQRRHDAFWNVVAGILNDEEGEYEDLPDWMTEVGSEILEHN
jgi:hypothetical protein